jgi:hypothetical protein
MLIWNNIHNSLFFTKNRKTKLKDTLFQINHYNISNIFENSPTYFLSSTNLYLCLTNSLFFSFYNEYNTWRRKKTNRREFFLNIKHLYLHVHWQWSNHIIVFVCVTFTYLVNLIRFCLQWLIFCSIYHLSCFIHF